MKDRDPAFLSFKPIEIADLRRLLALAESGRRRFFDEHSDWAELYSDRVIGVALCQGAALHFRDASHGINDFDVYTFYAAHPKRHWYAKAIRKVDFGDPKFGRSHVSNSKFVGRRVDLMGRALPVPPEANFGDALRDYLRNGKSRTARELAKKAMVVLSPQEEIGKVLWPLE
jgi:hypothetical protein